MYPQPLQAWIEHPVFGPQMRQLLDEISEQHGPKPVLEEPDKSEGGSKRKAEQAAMEEPVKKKLKPIAEVDGTELVSFTLPRQPNISVHLHSGNAVSIQNSGDKDVTLKKSTVVAGYGRGNFAFQADMKAEACKTACQYVPYKLVDSNTEAR